MPEQAGERIDFTVFEPGTNHPTRGFPIGRCGACGKPGVVWPGDGGSTIYQHFATEREDYLCSTAEEECVVVPPEPQA